MKRDPIEVGRELARKTLAGMRTSLRERFTPYRDAQPSVERLLRAGDPDAEQARQVQAFGAHAVRRALKRALDVETER